MRLEQADELDHAGLTVGPVSEGGREPDGAHAPLVERGRVPAARVVQVRPAAGHPGAEVGADGTENDDGPAGHVFAAVRADALDDRLRAAVADREAHPRPTDEVEPAAGRAVEDGVAGDRLGRGVGAEVGLRGDGDRAARQALRDVVVGLTGQPQLDAGPGERAERLPGDAAQLEPDRARAARRARGRRSGRPRTTDPPW